jgi:hypothetical protein
MAEETMGIGQGQITEVITNEVSANEREFCLGFIIHMQRWTVNFFEILISSLIFKDYKGQIRIVGIAIRQYCIMNLENEVIRT